MHLNGKLCDDEWALVQLLGDVGGAGLRRWFCGMRSVASAWEEECAGRLEAAGYHGGQPASTACHDPVGGVSVAVHGDDSRSTCPRRSCP